MPVVEVGPNQLRVNIPQSVVDAYTSGRLNDAGIKTQILSMSINDPQSIGLDEPLRPADLGLPDEGPARARGPLDAAMISAGKETVRLGSNVREALTRDPEKRAELQAQQEQMQEVTAPVREEFPKSSFAGEMLPGFAAPGGKVVQGVAGAALGALEGETLGERLTGAALGAGLSLGGSFIGDRIGSRVQNQLQRTARVSRAEPRRVLQNAGIRLTPGQRGSAVGRGTDIARSTISGRQPLFNQQVSKLNRMASKVIGENSDELTPSVLGRAAKRIGGVFESAGERLDENLPIDASEVVPRVQQAVQEVTDPQKLTGPARIFTKAVNEGIDGDKYVSLRSRLSKMSTQLWKNGNGIEAEVVDSMIDTLDDAVQATVPDLADDLAKARGQWRFLLALRRGAALDPEGNININSLSRAIDSKYPTADIGVFPEGDTGKFIETLKAFRSVVRPFRTSGTAERATQILGGAGIVGGAVSGTPSMGLVPVAVGAAPFLGGGAGSVLGGGTARAIGDPLEQALIESRRRGGQSGRQ